MFDLPKGVRRIEQVWGMESTSLLNKALVSELFQVNALENRPLKWLSICGEHDELI